MAVKYVPYFKDTISGQAILDNFTRTKRVLKYADNDKVNEKIERGLPLYETEVMEVVGKESDNLVIRGECLSACAYLKENNIKVDLVYIDPPFASGADYAKTVYIRRNPKVAEAVKSAEQTLDIEELKSFEEKMYGDIWNKEAYLNWMYENLMAIKSIMSKNASIYVHLDWHIGHYVKILMDEIFGEEKFVNEIVWRYRRWPAPQKSFQKMHDVIYKYQVGDNLIWNQLYEPKSESTLKAFGDIKLTTEITEHGTIKKVRTEEKSQGTYLSDVWEIPMVQGSASAERLSANNYATQKPEALLSKIIESSSNENMVVADFFGGSGVTAKVANDLGRKFIHCDVGINSIETTRDRLLSAGGSFKVLDIKDGVNLYRNPVQTMDKINSLIPGLVKDTSIDEFWSGIINDTKLGKIPVYIPNLMDSSTKILDVVIINKIVNQEIVKLDNSIKKVIVYYVDIIDEEEINNFIKDNMGIDVEIELRDLKEILNETIVDDILEYHVDSSKVVVDSFISDRLIRKIDEYNEKMTSQMLKKGKDTRLIEISSEGLELIEMISLDCTSSDGVWHSDEEIRIDKFGYVIDKGIKTDKFWNGEVEFGKKPLRIKVRSISGDEIIVNI